MYDLEKSDVMVCNSRAHNIYKHHQENDAIFLQRMNNPQPTSLKNTRLEFNLQTDSLNSRKAECTPFINKRGGNAIPCLSYTSCQGYKCYSEYHLNDFLLIPCKENTWRNYIECDDNKCCSVLHQMYDNHTRRI